MVAVDVAALLVGQLRWRRRQLVELGLDVLDALRDLARVRHRLARLLGHRRLDVLARRQSGEAGEHPVDLHVGEAVDHDRLDLRREQRRCVDRELALLVGDVERAGDRRRRQVERSAELGGLDLAGQRPDELDGLDVLQARGRLGEDLLGIGQRRRLRGSVAACGDDQHEGRGDRSNVEQRTTSHEFSPNDGLIPA